MSFKKVADKIKKSKQTRDKAAAEKRMAEPPTPELLAKCKDEVGMALMRAVKVLFDDEAHGGDFYAHVLMQMDRVFDAPGVPTAAVSVTNKINLYVNSYFFVHLLADDLDITKAEDKRKLDLKRAMIIKHEILHCIFHHLSRGLDFGNQALANIAADLVVNNCIREEVMGSQFLYPSQFKLPSDKSLDWYYKNYPIEEHPICETPSQHDKQHQQRQQQGQGQPGKGAQGEKGKDQGGQQDGDNGSPGGESGEGGNEEQEGQGSGSSQEAQAHDHAVDAEGKCTECGGQRTFDNHDIWKEGADDHMSDAMKESLINDALINATNATKNAGSLPNAIQDMIALARKKPQIPWQSILRQFASRISSGVLNMTKKRPSKRFKTYPGTKIRPKLKLAVAVDVSGSISMREYEIFLNEIFAMAKFIGEIEVIEWDTAVQGHYKIKGYKPNITRHGSGGTDPSDAIKWCNDRRNKFDGCVFFSDGYFCLTPEQKMRIPTLFVITATGSTEYCKNYRTIKLPQEESSAAS